jgi:hypothetical protein
MLNESAYVGKRILKVFVISINISICVFKGNILVCVTIPVSIKELVVGLWVESVRH